MDEGMVNMMNADIARRSGGSNYIFVKGRGGSGSTFLRLLAVFLISWLVLYFVSYRCMMAKYKKANGTECTNPLMKKKYATGSCCSALFFAMVVTLIAYFCAGSKSEGPEDWF